MFDKILKDLKNVQQHMELDTQSLLKISPIYVICTNTPMDNFQEEGYYFLENLLKQKIMMGNNNTFLEIFPQLDNNLDDISFMDLYGHCLSNLNGWIQKIITTDFVINGVICIHIDNQFQITQNQWDRLLNQMSYYKDRFLFLIITDKKSIKECEKNIKKKFFCNILEYQKKSVAMYVNYFAKALNSLNISYTKSTLDEITIFINDNHEIINYPTIDKITNHIAWNIAIENNLFNKEEYQSMITDFLKSEDIKKYLPLKINDKNTLGF